MRTFCLCRKLVACYRNYIDIHICLFENFFRKFIPGNKSTFICYMIFSVCIFFQHVYKQSCQIIRIRRRAYLIVYNSQRIMCFAQIQHCLDEILSVYAKYPCNTHNIIFVQQTFHSLLALIFGLAIHTQRTAGYRIVRLPWTCSFPVKHIVCTQIDHRNIQFFTYFCNIFCTFRIDFPTHFFIVFCRIHCCPGCTVYDAVYFCFPDHAVYRFCIRNIHFFNVYSNTFIASFCKFIHHVMTKLSFDSCY